MERMDHEGGHGTKTRLASKAGKPWHTRSRRGVIAIAMVLALILLQLGIVAMVVAGARRHDLAGARINSMRSFYAAEGGVNMGVRELMNNMDEDGDGTIGAVSDDGNSANNPGAGQATTFVVSKSVSGSQTILRSVATANSTVRFIEVVIE
jgi:hypothetical protein